MSKGFSAPLSREYALSEYLSNTGFRNILGMPNNILALEYIKALHKTSSAITPVPVKRIGNGYNDAIATTPYPSATSIRNMYKNNDTEGIKAAFCLMYTIMFPAKNLYLKKIFQCCLTRVYC